MLKNICFLIFMILLLSNCNAQNIDNNQKVKTNSSRPNIIVILADDIGFSDIGCYGGEVDTANLNTLASEGVRFSQFYNSARCMPTRACILTGLHPQQAGIGHMGKIGNSTAYQGYIEKDIPTIGNLMQDAGYTTLHVGKWHVGNNIPPTERGFEKSWARWSRVNYWNFKEVNDNGIIRAPISSEKEYLTDIEGQKAIEYINYATKKQKPFFMYLAFDAAHWPLHAKQVDIDKYRGKFKKGWKVLQKERLHKIDSIGLVSKIDSKLLVEEASPYWDSIPENDAFEGYHPMNSSEHDQDDWDLKMSVYAAQIDCMDQNIGKIIQRLKDLGQYENTMIFYLQDNGACPETIGAHDKNVPGTADSYISYGLPWAHLSNTPFKMYKHFVHEGGISTPLIVHWPNGLDKILQGRIEKESFGHVIDIVPTCLDLAGVYNKRSYPNLEGKSLLSVIKNQTDNNARTLFWEHEGNRAIRKGDWKLVSRYKSDFLFFKKWGFEKTPRTQEWELYNIKNDRWELNELSNDYPSTVEDLKKEYLEWAKRVGVIPREELINGTGIKF
tara:strand:+ start:4872 stop:6536 length:1665 start_codon:yes stop_codon:yes gene_type:complete